MEIIARVFVFTSKKIDLKKRGYYLAESAPGFAIRGANSPSPLPLLSLVSLLVHTMTRFGFLSLALFSLQAFVGTGFAAVCLSCP
jgi:hypothetical protein